MSTPTTVQVKIQLRYDTAATWASVNPVLLAGEAGLETDTNKIKIGNGSTAWNSLGYFPFVANGGTVTGNLEIGATGTLTFEGSSADNFETTLGVVNPTADRTITLPNQSGTVVVSGNASIVDADVSATAEIAVSKLADGAARQLLQTDAAGTGVEWTSNIDIPGTLDVTGAATFDAAVTITGDLTVNGTTTTISTQNLLVEDKNIIIGDVATPTDTTADGGGITLKGSTDKTINWVDATDAWTSSERFSIPLGSAAAPSLTFTGDPNTGVFSPSADAVALSTGGTERMRISNAGTTTLTSASATGPFIVKIDATECARFNGTGYLKVTSNGSYQLQSGTYNEFYQTADSPTVWGSATNASYTQAVYYATASRAANAAYFFFVGTSSYGGAADDEFKLYGDGNGKCDGAWTGGGADYAEYFEWSDSNPDEEDRRGISVVLDGDKIRESVAGEDPIGVISGNPSVVGDAAWNKWSGKYLRDEFGTYIQEDYEVEDEEGNTVIQQRRKLNPAYDPDVEYVSREQRPEWDCVGLMGKLRIRKGQVTGSRWIKMRDINDSVEEWLVR